MSTPPRPAATPDRERTTREQIQDVAMLRFAEQGYDGTSMREIAEDLGITKAALYYHFASKEDLVRSLLADLVGQVEDLVAWAREQQMTPQVRREVLDRWCDIMHAHGFRMFRFMAGNRRVLQDAKPKLGLPHLVGDLTALLAPEGASIEDQLRIRVALMAVNAAGMGGSDLDGREEEVLAAARRLSVELMPGL